ncbi:MAG: hypothetical protein P8N02_08540, partial [Actinomycetota bacterium]|nr:hypothetical protein [Actinomycetota bacterium]
PPTAPTAAPDAPQADGGFAWALAQSDSGPSTKSGTAASGDNHTDVGTATEDAPLQNPTAGSTPIHPMVATEAETIAAWMRAVTGAADNESPEGHSVPDGLGPTGLDTEAIAASVASVDMDGPLSNTTEVAAHPITVQASSTVPQGTAIATSVMPQVDVQLDQPLEVIGSDTSASQMAIHASEIHAPSTPVTAEEVTATVEDLTGPTDSVDASSSPTADATVEQTQQTEPTPTTQVDTPEVAEVPDVAPLSSGATVEPGNQASRPMIDSGTLQRVEAALEQLENSPPPRHLVLDIGDEGGIRIRLSSTADGVQVDVRSNDGREHESAWEQDLRQRLAERGFELDQERSQDQDDEAEADGTPTISAPNNSAPTTPANPSALSNTVVRL